MVAYGYQRRVTREMIARSRARTHAAVADLAGHEVHGYDPMVAAARAMDRAELAAVDALSLSERLWDERRQR